MDGVDGVLADFEDSSQPARVLTSASRPFSPALRQELLALNTPGDNELHRAALAANALARLYAKVVSDLLQASQLAPAQITAIGAHGQTVRHRPQEFDGTGYTLQLNQPALLAELCGIDVVADFPRRLWPRHTKPRGAQYRWHFQHHALASCGQRCGCAANRL